jgi:putative colanic acid biosynthesis acetyltransferase WcaF
MPVARDIHGNRHTSRYSPAEYAGRALWAAARVVFRCIPGPLRAPRNWLLRLFGATIGRHVHIQRTAEIAIPWNLVIGDYSSIGDHARIYNLGPIRIGERTTISQYAHLCAGTHDHNDPVFPLLKPPIMVGSDAWVCAEAFVGPGVTVGDHAIVAAAAVAMRDVPPGAIVAGNPARIVRMRA